MSMSQKRKVKELEGKVTELEETVEAINERVGMLERGSSGGRP